MGGGARKVPTDERWGSEDPNGWEEALGRSQRMGRGARKTPKDGRRDSEDPGGCERVLSTGRLPLAAHSAAGGLAGVDGVSLVDLDLSSDGRRARRGRTDARLDLRRHCHESLLHVCGILRRSLEERYPQLFGVLLLNTPIILAYLKR